MTYRGHVEDGAIVLDEPMDLPEGTLVRVELAVLDSAKAEDAAPSLAESLASVIGAGLPVDWSENHDEYLREEYSK